MTSLATEPLKKRQRRTVHALAVALEHEAVPEDQVLDGEPTTAAKRLGQLFGVEVGLWEMTSGVVSDVEAEEFFVVLSGSATIQIHATNGFESAKLRLEPGTVCHLSEGMHTSWTVHEPLRKIYLTLPSGHDRKVAAGVGPARHI